MLRRLLTLIAIATGLAAVSAPVQARAEALGGVLMAAESRQESSSEVVVHPVSDSAPSSLGSARNKWNGCVPLAARPCTPPVMMGIDRARE